MPIIYIHICLSAIPVVKALIALFGTSIQMASSANLSQNLLTYQQQSSITVWGSSSTRKSPPQSSHLFLLTS